MKKIYIHGLGQTPESWKAVTDCLGDEDPLRPDLTEMIRGETATYRALYAGFSDVCDSCATPLTLCGLSLGGVLALHYAVDRPERVGALVLVAAQCKMPKTMLRLQNVLFRLMPKSAFADMWSSKEGVISLCRSMSELDFTESLSKIACPTLIVCGGKDAANRKASEEMAGAIKRSRLAIVPDAGHEINTEAPERLAALLRDFYGTCG